jgi:general secretion pathway protein G
MRQRFPRRRERGFTILEIVIVFVLLAGIMAFIGPKIWEQATKAKSAQAKIQLQQLVGNIELYKLEVGRYPDNLGALVTQPGGLDKWNGPYAKAADLKDVWGNDYKYVVPGQGKPYDLVSLGADGREGGDGENRDISN